MESQDDNDQMRQMMGFSSFGGKPKHKPKKAGAPNAPGTSSNLTPLGHRSTLASDTLPRDLPSRTPVSKSTLEQNLDEKKSQWVAARLPNPSVANESSASNADALVSGTIATHPKPPLENQHQDKATNLATPPEHSHLTKSPSLSSLNVQAQPFHPSPTTNKPTTYSKNDVRSDSTYWTSIKDKQTHETQIGYVSPWTGTEMTRNELREYSTGKSVVQADGEATMVYFKPSFVEEDIWGEWEKKDKK